MQASKKPSELGIKQMISSNTQFDRDDMSMMSSVLGRRESDRKLVVKKRTELNIHEGRIDEIEKELEEMDSPDPKRDVLDDAHDLVDDDDMIS